MSNVDQPTVDPKQRITELERQVGELQEALKRSEGKTIAIVSMVSSLSRARSSPLERFFASGDMWGRFYEVLPVLCTNGCGSDLAGDSRHCLDIEDEEEQRECMAPFIKSHSDCIFGCLS